MPRVTKEQREAARLCSIPGCGRPWTSTFKGRLCALHNDPPAPARPVIPTTPPAKPWSDTERDDDAPYA